MVYTVGWIAGQYRRPLRHVATYSANNPVERAVQVAFVIRHKGASSMSIFRIHALPLRFLGAGEGGVALGAEGIHFHGHFVRPPYQKIVPAFVLLNLGAECGEFFFRVFLHHHRPASIVCFLESHLIIMNILTALGAPGMSVHPIPPSSGSRRRRFSCALP